MLKVVDQDILTAKEGIVCHQVNCMGIMGGGVARQLAMKFPYLEKAYIENTTLLRREAGYQMLGQVFKYKTRSDYGNVQVWFNIYSQWGISDSECLTNYLALFRGIIEAVKEGDLYGQDIAMPYKIGCGIAGGDWNLVYNFLVAISKNFRKDIVLYRYNG